MNPNNGVSDAENLRVSQLGILQLTPTEWLVRDPALPDGDPAALMGVIEQIGGAYGVTKLGVLNTRWFYSSFDRAQASFLVPGTPEPPGTFGPTEPVSSRVTD
ncbi:hypothetical protein [Cryobacterium sp. TMS1-13-1]|uniref:hypothetical protein n=1 Tax=Cryobacterium sp. TMS1-13-1 TaxID=1259220 RepID=UPI00106968EC|nr:hypothetical protein [Cryobacterium sp. TMS1-13-1]TFD20140.1 hypothetical protein E3T31_14530 [Cryobacterium sp. TMS1-13-1]